MKLTKLHIVNIGLIADETIELNKPLILFYGQIQQGKTTILNAVRYVFGGAFPTDLLRHGEKQGLIRLEFEGGYLQREFYRADDGTVKSRPLVFVQGGNRVVRPVEALKKFLNPFLLDQDHLAKMTELERRKYFTDLFNVNTEALDSEDAKCAERAQVLRAEVKAYGEIDLTKFERVNVESLRADLHRIREHNDKERRSVQEHNDEVALNNSRRVTYEATSRNWDVNITELEARLVEARAKKAEVVEWLRLHPHRDDVAEPEFLPVTEIEQAIQDAGANNVRAEIYEKNVTREQERKAKNLEVSQLEGRQREIYREKENHLTKLSEECGVPGLKFLPKGDFEYLGTRAGMLSTSQLMDLSSRISALYPTGFGLDLLDRGESLGKAIFEVVERAKAENKTVLATIVGERPATVPADVGVFIVEGGKIS